MMRLHSATMLAIVLGVTAGCGGGSDGSPSVSGEYRGALRLVADSCSDKALPVDDSIGVFHIVNQDGQKVVLDDADGFTYTGLLNTAENGFVATAESFEVIIEGQQNCTALAQIEYSEIKESGAHVTTLGTVTCSGATFCTTSWQGELERGEASR